MSTLQKNILNRQIQSKPIEEKIEENVFGCGVTAATYRTAVRLLSRVSCLQDIGEKKKGKLTMCRTHGGGIKGACAFADHCKIGPVLRKQSDCHSAGFSSLNTVWEWEHCRTFTDLVIPSHSRSQTHDYRAYKFLHWCPASKKQY